MRIIDGNLLEGALVTQDTGRVGTSGKYRSGLPDTIIMHYTAGSSINGAVNHWRETNSASAHLVIGRDGDIVQVVPFDTIAWHAGTSQWKDRKGLNNYSIGIEMVNVGYLTLEDGRFKDWTGRTIADDQVFDTAKVGSHQYWQEYTKPQIQNAIDVCAVLKSALGCREILCHSEISPGRKEDPGPAFPIDLLRSTVFGFAKDSTEDNDNKAPEKVSVPIPLPNLEKQDGGKKIKQVEASKLNIRTGPSSSDPIAGEPLVKGQKVQVLETMGSWSKVSIQVEAWVSNKYLKDVAE
ncbi:MAG: N-acetylmuramoyl-L-alanine amidase [Magnetococcales bacterium]|nr:N-acetylmuramoyl-L-alanine amidase [Magnetococcales bacterium]